MSRFLLEGVVQASSPAVWSTALHWSRQPPRWLSSILSGPWKRG